jgi:hypothetical protein
MTRAVKLDKSSKCFATHVHLHMHIWQLMCVKTGSSPMMPQRRQHWWPPIFVLYMHICPPMFLLLLQKIQKIQKKSAKKLKFAKKSKKSKKAKICQNLPKKTIFSKKIQKLPLLQPPRPLRPPRPTWPPWSVL